jgi:hypothetical protein
VTADMASDFLDPVYGQNQGWRQFTGIDLRSSKVRWDAVQRTIYGPANRQTNSCMEIPMNSGEIFSLDCGHRCPMTYVIHLPLRGEND